jgi:hypothetical protein
VKISVFLQIVGAVKMFGERVNNNNIIVGLSVNALTCSVC